MDVGVSSVWVSAWPSHEDYIDGREMAETITTYLGRESPAVRHLAGRHIHERRRLRVCDEFGFELGLAKLPGSADTVCHDAISTVLFQLALGAGIQGAVEPRHLFHAVIPAHVLHDQGAPPAVVPDAYMHVALQLEGRMRARRATAADWMLDVKTLHGRGSHYKTCDTRRQTAAVANRAAAVPTDYARHARAIDTEHGLGGAVEARLRMLGDVAGLVVGQYAEGSPAVHALIAAIASAMAGRRWRLLGFRSEAEALSATTTIVRRRVGVAAARAYARHRISRVPYIGVPRAVIERQMARQAATRAGHSRGHVSDAALLAHQLYHDLPR